MLRRGGSFERVVGKLRSVDGAKNVTRLIMVQRIFSQPTVVLKVVFELKNTAFASFRMTGHPALSLRREKCHPPHHGPRHNLSANDTAEYRCR